MKRFTFHPEGAILDNLLGELDARARAAVIAHVAVCPACRQLEVEWREALASDGGRATRVRRNGIGIRTRLGWAAALASRIRRPDAELLGPSLDEGGSRPAEGWMRDRRDGSAELSVRRLSPLPVGQVYVLWCVHMDAWRNIGAFAVDGAGTGGLTVPLSAQSHAVGARLFVTAERHANEATPRGAVHLAGRWT